MTELDLILDEVEEFLKGLQDTTDGQYGPTPNRAMQLLTALKFARSLTTKSN